MSVKNWKNTEKIDRLGVGHACLAKVMEDSLDSERDEDDNTANNSDNPGGGILQTLSLFSLRHLSQSSVSNSFLDDDEPHIREKKKGERNQSQETKPRRVVEMESYTIYKYTII